MNLVHLTLDGGLNFYVFADLIATFEDTTAAQPENVNALVHLRGGKRIVAVQQTPAEIETLIEVATTVDLDTNVGGTTSPVEAPAPFGSI